MDLLRMKITIFVFYVEKVFGVSLTCLLHIYPKNIILGYEKKV